jgi:replicative DNA helicase
VSLREDLGLGPRAGDERLHAERIRSGDRFILDAPQTVPAIWGAGSAVAWPKGEGLLLVGPVGVGKTSIAAQLARCLIGLQSELLGMPVGRVDKLLYLALDRPQQIARALRRNFTESDRETLLERFEAWTGPLPFDLAAEPDQLAAFARQRGAGALIIDSAKDAAMDLSKDETGSRLNRAIQSTLAAGVEVCVLHHQRKANAQNPKPGKLADVYGSTWLTAGAGSVLLLWGEPGDPLVELRTLKPAVGEIGPLLIEHDHERGVSTIHEQPDLLELLRASSGGVTVSEAAIFLFGDRPSRAEREKARRKLAASERGGEAQRVPDSTPPRFMAVTPRDPQRDPLTVEVTAGHEPLEQASRPGSRGVTGDSESTATPLRGRVLEVVRVER